MSKSDFERGVEAERERCAKLLDRLRGLEREMKYSSETLYALGDKPAAKLTEQWAGKLADELQQLAAAIRSGKEGQ